MKRLQAGLFTILLSGAFYTVHGATNPGDKAPIVEDKKSAHKQLATLL